MAALVTNIQGYSLHDGPGIRTVVFFKGCNLACQWCANPECLSFTVQIGFIANLCAQCGKCSAVCPESALNSAGSKHRIDYSRCKACGKCAEVCYYKALAPYGREMRPDEVFEYVLQDKMFYDTSGGGVTVSGGEPLLQAGFVQALFELCKNAGINTCAETSGYVNSSDLLSVLPLTDNILFDIKHMNSDVHKKYTGRSNELILRNAELAAEKCANILIRMPLIPTVNDSEENIAKTADFVKRIMNSPRVQLIPFHRYGESKYKALNIADKLRAFPVPEAEKLEWVKMAFIGLGVDCSISK